MEVKQVCAHYAQAQELAEQGIHLISTDEKTGIQALERAHPTRPMLPGKVARYEFEYIRHGTLALIANFDVARGTMVAPSIGPTRTEIDFAAHILRSTVQEIEANLAYFGGPMGGPGGPPSSVSLRPHSLAGGDLFSFRARIGVRAPPACRGIEADTGSA